MLKRYTLQNSDPHRGAQSYTARECLGDMSAVTPEFTQLLRDSWDDFLVCFSLSLHTEVILGVKKDLFAADPDLFAADPRYYVAVDPTFLLSTMTKISPIFFAYFRPPTHHFCFVSL